MLTYTLDYEVFGSLDGSTEVELPEFPFAPIPGNEYQLLHEDAINVGLFDPGSSTGDGPTASNRFINWLWIRPVTVGTAQARIAIVDGRTGDTQTVVFDLANRATTFYTRVPIFLPHGSKLQVRGFSSNGIVPVILRFNVQVTETVEETLSVFASLCEDSTELFYYDVVQDFNAPNDGTRDATAEIQAALDTASTSGNKGWVYIPEGSYRIRTITQPTNVTVFGAGISHTTLRVISGVTVGWDFPSGFDRGELSHLQILGPDSSNPQGTGINLNQAQRIHLHHLAVWYFDVGILLSDGAAFSAYNTIGPSVEVNVGHIGIRAYDNANGNTIHDTRIFWQFDAGNGGIGIDIRDASGLMINGVQIESADTCIKIRNVTGATRVSISTPYLEPGTNPTTLQVGTAYDVDVENVSGEEMITGQALVISANRGSANLSPEGLVRWDGYSRQFFGARFDGAAPSKKNFVYNGEFSYFSLGVIPNWFTGGTAPTLAESGTFVTGSRSLQATANATNSQVFAAFTVSDWCDYVTCGIRYQILPGNVGFFFGATVGANTVQFVPETTPTSTWRTSWVQVEVDPTNRSGSIGFYPDNINGNGSVLVDAVWAVPGRFAVPEPVYNEKTELLPSPITIYSNSTTGDVVIGPIDLTTLPSTLAPPLDDFSTAPRGLVGAILRVRISATNAAPNTILPSSYSAFIDIPATGAVVAATTQRAVTVWDSVNGESTIVVRDTTITGGVTTSGGLTWTCSVALVGWIMS